MMLPLVVVLLLMVVIMRCEGERKRVLVHRNSPNRPQQIHFLSQLRPGEAAVEEVVVLVVGRGGGVGGVGNPGWIREVEVGLGH